MEDAQSECVWRSRLGSFVEEPASLACPIRLEVVHKDDLGGSKLWMDLMESLAYSLLHFTCMGCGDEQSNLDAFVIQMHLDIVNRTLLMNTVEDRHTVNGAAIAHGDSVIGTTSNTTEFGNVSI